MSREATSEQSSVHDRVGYDEVFQTGLDLEEGLSLSSKREALTHSPDEEVESYVGKGGEEEIDEGEDGGDKEEEDEGDEENDGDEGGADERALEAGSSGRPWDGHARPFILPKMWTVNDLLPTMTANIFKNLRDHY